jgi:hypothetical protein
MNIYIIALGEIIICQGAGTPVGWHPLLMFTSTHSSVK